jgi:competence protein ComEC
VQKRTAAPKSQIKDRWRLRLISRLVSFFLVSFFAVCGSLPLVALYFNQISLVGLAANSIVVPLVGFLTIPLGLVALFVSPLSTTVAFWCIQAGCGILTIALGMVQFFAELPFAAVKTFTPGLLEIGCYYVLCWALLNLHREPRFAAVEPRSGAGGSLTSVTSNFEMSLSGINSGLSKVKDILRGLQFKRISQSDLAKATLVLVLITLTADTCYWLYQRFGYADFRVTVIDVGHGGSSLLEFPGGYTMLIDGGGFSDNSAFDVGAAIVAPLLWRKKIRTVDTVFRF